jgi:hypothetical protein
MGIVLQHRAHLVRFVRVWEVELGQWEARFHDGATIVWRTERGSLHLVRSALVNTVPDKGLPIVMVPTRPRRSGGQAAC